MCACAYACRARAPLSHDREEWMLRLFQKGISNSKQCTWLSLIAMLSGWGNYCPASAAAVISNIRCLHKNGIWLKHVLETEIGPSVNSSLALSLSLSLVFSFSRFIRWYSNFFIECFYFCHLMSGISDLLRALSHISRTVWGFCGLETNHCSPYSQHYLKLSWCTA